jgi:ethanolamine utilization protein EutN
MKIARVIGSVESVIKHPTFANTIMLVVQPLDEQLNPRGRTHPAIDTVGAGTGDIVLVVEEGKSARERVGQKNVPMRTLIVGIVDSVDVMAREETGKRNNVA